jgi:flagellar motor switch protein FliN
MFSSLISSSSSDPAGQGLPGAAAPGLPVPPDAHASGAANAGAGHGPGQGPASAANAGGAAHANSGGGDPFGLFRDVSCPVDVVLGIGQISLRRCLALERGSVVRLHQSAGEDLQVMVNGVRIAHAEVVIIDETVAVRLTNFAGPIGREKRL